MRGRVNASTVTLPSGTPSTQPCTSSLLAVRIFCRLAELSLGKTLASFIRAFYHFGKMAETWATFALGLFCAQMTSAPL